jgi:hypothetical protein
LLFWVTVHTVYIRTFIYLPTRKGELTNCLLVHRCKQTAVFFCVYLNLRIGFFELFHIGEKVAINLRNQTYEEGHRYIHTCRYRKDFLNLLKVWKNLSYPQKSMYVCTYLLSFHAMKYLQTVLPKDFKDCLAVHIRAWGKAWKQKRNTKQINKNKWPDQ